jgi:hypothetical protein
MTHVVECLPGKPIALSWNPNTTKEKLNQTHVYSHLISKLYSFLKRGMVPKPKIA